MGNADDISKAVHRYIEAVAEGRIDDIIELFADDASVEDPVGSEVHIGREAIRRFYSAIEGAQGHAELFALRVAGAEAAFHVQWTLPGQGVRLDPIDVMVFDDNGRIVSLKAYWSNDIVTPL